MPRCQVKDILADVAPSVGDSGVCATKPEGVTQILAALNRAILSVMTRIDADGMLWQWSVPVSQGCFALPPDCLQGRQYFVNGNSAVSRDEWFLGKLSRGLNDCGIACGRPEIIDIGEFPIPIPLPKTRGIRIALVADNDGDAGVECDVEVVDEYGKRQRQTVTLLAGQEAAVMTVVAYEVTYFGKPKTQGSVWLQFHFDNGQRWHVCQYDPAVRHGAFRRKRLPQRYWGCNLVTIKGKMRFERLTSEDDILPFCNLNALDFALQSFALLRKRDRVGYNEALTFAINELAKELQDVDSPGNVTPMVIRSGFRGNPSQASGRKCWL